MRKLLKRINLGLSTKEGKLKAVIILSGIALLLVFFIVGALELTSTPRFCQSCHEMRPEYVTWKSSAHSQISCIDCHIDPGTKNFLVHKIKSFDQLYKHFTGKVYAPITIDKTISDEVCERCHTPNRVATPSGDIKIPHKVHKESKVPCVICHQAVAHAKIGEEGFTADGNWEKWSEPIGKAYMRADFLRFSMMECIDCHKAEDSGPKSDDCKACHNKLIKPESHSEAKFISTHGEEAQRNIKQCDKCHRITMTDDQIKSDDPIVTYTRQNHFCTDCHSNAKKLPPSHLSNWKLTHIVSATDNRNGCLVCHDEGRPSKRSKATKTFCYQCHLTNIHPIIKLGRHDKYPLVKNQALTKNPCFSCHNTANCLKCHYVPQSNQEIKLDQLRKTIPDGTTLNPTSPQYNSERYPRDPGLKPNSPGPGGSPASPPPIETG